MSKIRVFLVDDQVLFVESLKTVLELRAEDIEIVGIAHDGREALDCLERLEADIVLLDVRMPLMDGVETARLIHERHPGCRVVMLTTFDDDEYVHEALLHGAVGYMLKNLPPNDLIASIRAVMSGTVQIAPSVMEKLVREETRSVTTAEELRRTMEPLSRREKEVLYLLSKGYDNPRIAERLFIAEQTVKNHISRIYAKLGSHNRIAAVDLARSLDIARECAHLED